MKEILFRGKRTDNGEWVEGYLYITQNGEYEISYYSKYYDCERYTNIVIQETVGQYTGLTDKNGKKIFEGDILNTTNSDYVIWCVDSKNTAFCCNQGKANYSCVLDVFMQYSDVEVIGNFHDNPELLEVQE